MSGQKRLFKKDPISELIKSFFCPLLNIVPIPVVYNGDKAVIKNCVKKGKRLFLVRKEVASVVEVDVDRGLQFLVGKKLGWAINGKAVGFKEL